MLPVEPLLRSVLFVPAAHARALAKSAAIPADALIFDLEDSAADEEKDAARESLRAHLKAVPRRAGDPLRVVRINPLRTRHGTEDLLMARGARVDAILLPKVDGPERLREADGALIETARGVANALAIADAALRYRLGALVVGPNDLVAEANLRLSPGRSELMPWLGPVLIAGRAAGVPVLDGVFNDFSDAAGFAAECHAARDLGFSGKTLIHPAQVGAAEAAFSPSPAEIAGAQAIVAAFADPAAAGRGVVRLDGRMVERLHLVRAEALLARAHLIAIQSRETTP